MRGRGRRLVISSTYGDIWGEKLGQISEPSKPPNHRYRSIPVETDGFSRLVIERLAKTALTNTKQNGAD